MRFDSRATVCKTVSYVISRSGIILIKKSKKTIRTQKRIIRTDTDKTVEMKGFGRLYKSVEHIIFVSPIAADTGFTGNLCQDIILRTVGSGKNNRLADAGLPDIINQDVYNALPTVEREQYFIMQPGRTGPCLNDDSIFHNFIRLKASI